MEPTIIAYDANTNVSATRLEDELEALYYAINGPIKSMLSNWHDIMFKVRIAKMGYITLTDKDVADIHKALGPVRVALTTVDARIRSRIEIKVAQ